MKELEAKNGIVIPPVDWKNDKVMEVYNLLRGGAYTGNSANSRSFFEKKVLPFLPESIVINEPFTDVRTEKLVYGMNDGHVLGQVASLAVYENPSLFVGALVHDILSDKNTKQWEFVTDEDAKQTTSDMHLRYVRLDNRLLQVVYKRFFESGNYRGLVKWALVGSPSVCRIGTGAFFYPYTKAQNYLRIVRGTWDV